MGKVGRPSSWCIEDIKKLQETCFEGCEKSYKELLKLFSNKTIKQIKSKCESLKLNKFLVHSNNSWSKQE